jgi:hypothetical protein
VVVSRHARDKIARTIKSFVFMLQYRTIELDFQFTRIFLKSWDIRQICEQLFRRHVLKKAVLSWAVVTVMLKKINHGWLRLLLITALTFHLHLSFSHGHLDKLDLDFNRPALCPALQSVLFKQRPP